jgi:integrase
MEVSINSALWFSLRTDKVLKDGKAPISLFYSLNNVRVRFNTDQKIFPAYWDKDERKAIFIKPADNDHVKALAVNDRLDKSEIEAINNSLADIKKGILSIEKAYLFNKVQFSAKMVIDEYKDQQSKKLNTIIKVDEPKGLLFEYMDKYIQDHEATREPGSLTVYKSVKNHLKAYEIATGHRVTFETIDYNFFNKLNAFLIKRTKIDSEGTVSPMLNNTTIAKALSTLKTFLGYARREGLKVNDSYRDYTIKKEKLEVIALEQEEFDAIMSLDLSENKRLDKCRDLFIFSCVTGFRYSDVAQLKREHIDQNIITLTVKKTKTELTVPLNSISAAIINKYNDQHRPLPTVSNQGLNRSIKDLCQLAGIDKPIEIVRFNGKKRLVVVYPKYELCHFHTGRKTFVTLSLEKGMSAEEVMEISGHSDYRSFKRYVKVTEKRKKTVMLKAWGEPMVRLKIVS